MDKVISFYTKVDKKDLEAFARSLHEQVNKLRVENEQLREKVEHLEELLRNSNIPEVK